MLLWNSTEYISSFVCAVPLVYCRILALKKVQAEVDTLRKAAEKAEQDKHKAEQDKHKAEERAKQLEKDLAGMCGVQSFIVAVHCVMVRLYCIMGVVYACPWSRRLYLRLPGPCIGCLHARSLLCTLLDILVHTIARVHVTVWSVSAYVRSRRGPFHTRNTKRHTAHEYCFTAAKRTPGPAPQGWPLCACIAVTSMDVWTCIAVTSVDVCTRIAVSVVLSGIYPILMTIALQSNPFWTRPKVHSDPVEDVDLTGLSDVLRCHRVVFAHVNVI